MKVRSDWTRRILRDLQRANAAGVCLGVLAAVLAAGAAFAAEPGEAQAAGASFGGLAAAALAVGFGCAGAGYAVAHIGAAAMGAVSERPELAGRTLIFVGLAEGIAIYGLIVAVMILGRV